MSFTARFGGKCAAECGIRIQVGDHVEHVDGYLVHFGETPTPEPEPRPTCPNCYIEISLNGACACDF